MIRTSEEEEDKPEECANYPRQYDVYPRTQQSMNVYPRIQRDDQKKKKKKIRRRRADVEEVEAGVESDEKAGVESDEKAGVESDENVF